MPRIVAYTWTSGTTSGLPGALDATSTLGLREQATPLAPVYVRPAVPVPLYAPDAATDQLTEWETLADASALAGNYALSYSPTTRRVTIASSEAFQPILPEATAAWLGMTQTITGYATSWTGDAEPAGIMELIGATVEPVEDWALIDFEAYRHGRVRSVGWGNHYVARVVLVVRAARYAGKPYCMTGRVRIVQSDSVTDPYSPSEPGGVVDGYVVGVGDVTEIGDTGETLTIPMVLAIPRSA